MNRRDQKEANGFTFVEILVSLLLLSIIVASSTEILKATVKYTKKQEVISNNIDNSLRIKYFISNKLGVPNGSLLNVSDTQLVYFDRPVKTININKSNNNLIINYYEKEKRRDVLKDTIIINGLDFKFEKEFNFDGTLRNIKLLDISKSKKIIILTISIENYLKRPCIIDQVTASCR